MNKVALYLDAIPYASTLAIVAWAIESVTGLMAPAYVAFVGIFMIDWFTGMKASRYRGEKISSSKFPRKALDIFLWSVILVVLNTMGPVVSWKIGIKDMNADLNLFRFIWWIVLISCMLTEFFSIMENMRDMGSKTADRIVFVMSSVLTGPAKFIWDSIAKKNKTPKQDGK